MGHIPLLDELALVAALGVAVTVLLSKLRLPTVAGLLAAGALLGPFGLGLVRSVHAIELLAEVGVVLLLFTIGLEFSLARLKDIFKQVAVGAGLQLGLTLGVTVALALALGKPAGLGVFYGFVFTLSCTPIGIRALTERRELDAPHGRFIVGTLIFQDLSVVPMMLLVPLLGASGSILEVAGAVGQALGKGAAVVVGVVVVSRFVVPKLLGMVEASRSREVFLMAILALCIGTAWLTSLAGLSLALGAFLGGMVVADTEYGHRAMGDILPLRDAFVSLFFISLGMLFDVRVLLEQPWLVGALLLGFLVVKGMVATLAAMVMRFPVRVAWLAGVGLAQFGEFGFVLVRLAQSHGLMTADDARPLLAAGILSMFLTTLLVRAAPHITAGERLLAPLSRLLGVKSIDEADSGPAALTDHVVVVGFGPAGQLLADALLALKKPLVILELNAENVRAGRALGLPVFLGDATSEEVLHHAQLERAALVVLLINDPQALLRVVSTLARVSPQVPVMARTHYTKEQEGLFKVGAGEVVVEEVEGAVEIIARTLRWLDVPRNLINERLRAVRAKTQTRERRLTLPRVRLGALRALDELKIESMEVRPDSAATEQSAVALDLRRETGALLVAVRRGEALLESPDPNEPLKAGDVVYLVGTGDAIRKAEARLELGAEEEPRANPGEA